MESPDTLGIIIVGAGLSSVQSLRIITRNKLTEVYSGICAAVRLRSAFPDASISLFESGDSVGGTWAKNTYTGLSCDIPSQVKLERSVARSLGPILTP